MKKFRGETMSDWDDENYDVRIAFGEMSLRDRLAEALLDENGLRPTTAALDVLESVVRALDEVDGGWNEPGVPLAQHYIPIVSARLHELRLAR